MPQNRNLSIRKSCLNSHPEFFLNLIDIPVVKLNKSFWLSFSKAVMKTGLLCGSLVFLYFHLDIDSVIEALLRYNPVNVVLLSLWFLTSFFLLGIRLYIIGHERIRLKESITAVFLGFFTNSIFPARIGEGIKGLYLKLISQKTSSQIFTFIFWERFSDLNMLLLLVIFLSIMGEANTYLLPVSLIAFLIWGTLMLIHIRYRNNALKINALRFDWIKNIARHFSGTPDRAAIMQLITINLLVWAQFILEMLIAIYWVAGYDIPLFSALNVFLISSLAFAIPAAPGGIGVYDAAIVFSLGLYEIKAGDAMALAILMRTIQYIPVSLIGITMIITGGSKLQEIIRPSSARKILASMALFHKKTADK